MTKNSGKIVIATLPRENIVPESIYDILQTYNSLAVLLETTCIDREWKWYETNGYTRLDLTKENYMNGIYQVHYVMNIENKMYFDRDYEGGLKIAFICEYFNTNKLD